MTNAAAKGGKLFFLAAAFALFAAILAAPAAEATRTLAALAEPAQTPQRATLDVLEDATPKPHIEPEKRLRLFEDLSWPTHPLELVQISKTASGVFDLGLDCNILEKGGLSQDCGSPSFQGLWHDPTTGLAYARNRWYDARTASWLSEDPLGPVDSPNLYAFVAWGPHMGTDPMGESFWRRLWAARKIPHKFNRVMKLDATIDLWKRVKRSDVVGLAADGRATVGGRRVTLPAEAELGVPYKYRAKSGVDYEVPISPEGWVDFSAYSKYDLTDFQMTGDSKLDIKRAKEIYKKETGLDSPRGFTWHHDPDGSTMRLVPTELNKGVKHTGGDAITRAAIERVADEGGFLKKAGGAAVAFGAVTFQVLAPNTSKAEGLGDGAASVAVDALDFVDPGVQDVYGGAMWITNKVTDLDIEVQYLEDFHDVFLADPDAEHDSAPGIQPEAAPIAMIPAHRPYSEIECMPSH